MSAGNHRCGDVGTETRAQWSVMVMVSKVDRPECLPPPSLQVKGVEGESMESKGFVLCWCCTPRVPVPGLRSVLKNKFL